MRSTCSVAQSQPLEYLRFEARPMPDKTIKRRLQDLGDAVLVSDDGPIFSTLAKLVKAIQHALRTRRRERRCGSAASCSAARSTTGKCDDDESPPRRRARRGRLYLAAFGMACLVVVVLTHVCEARHLLPWMGWGLKHSAGHYLDLSSAILGLALVPSGFILRTLCLRAHS